MRCFPTYFSCAVLLTLLSGCVGTTTSPQKQLSWAERSGQLRHLTHWTALGKISLRSTEHAESGRLVWEQKGNLSHVRVSGPMGLNTTTVDSDGEHLTIRQGDHYSRWPIERYRLQYPGWNLPITALPHWLKGVPDPSLSIQTLQLDRAKRLPIMLQQQGWTINYDGFDDFDGQQLPTRLRLVKGDTHVKVILRDWQGGPH